MRGKPIQQLGGETPCPPSHHSCLCRGCEALPPPPPLPPLHQLWKSSDSCLTHFNCTPGENTRFFSAWLIKSINTQANVASKRAGWGRGDLLVAVDRAPTHPGSCGVSRVPGCSPRAAWADSGNGSERAREEQSGETARSPWVSNFHPSASLLQQTSTQVPGCGHSGHSCPSLDWYQPAAHLAKGRGNWSSDAIKQEAQYLHLKTLRIWV